MRKKQKSGKPSNRRREGKEKEIDQEKEKLEEEKTKIISTEY